MEETDEAMVPHAGGGMPLAVYPPLPPYSEQSLQRTHETTTRTAVLQDSDTRRQVETLAQHFAAVQQRTDEQPGQVQRQQERPAEHTSEYLPAQYDRQTALLEQQKEMRRQMDENRLYLEEQYRLPRVAEQAVGMQGRQSESLAEADEKDVTKTEWKNYFLPARIPDNTAYKTLDREVKSPCVDVNLQDAESRLSRLMVDYYEIVDRLNMEDIVQAEPKKVVEYLVEALRPPAFKSAVKDQLSRQAHKPTKHNIQLFLKWLRGELDSFMRFEAQMAVQHPHQQNSTKSASWPTAGGYLKKLRRGNQNVANYASGGTGQQKNKPDRRNGKSDNLKQSNRADKKMFQELYEKRIGEKVMKPVLSVATGTKTTESSAAIPCTVMDVVETRITPDSAAEVSVVTEKLLDALDKAGSKLERQDLPKLSAVIGIGDKPVPVRSKVKLDLRFSTRGGPFILQNVICWVTQDFQPVGVGDFLLSRNIVGRLGCSSKKLRADAQSWQEIWDMEDADDDRSHNLVRVLAYSGTAQVPEPTAEELQLQEEENCACFPNFEASGKQDGREVIAVLEEKLKMCTTQEQHVNMWINCEQF
ncbi:hypothetical protein ON010_g16736 [Phytophthora cinnamomi]|nr:hypothetical protein ON010_g16736 [Phytophthora cinnamomi]